MKNNRSLFLERDVQTFLRNILGQSSFLNKSKNKDQLITFKKDFEDPLFNSSNPVSKKESCLHCNQYQAKKKTIFSSGLVPYLGLNQDSTNFTWNFNPNLPICEFCEIIYFCHFAGYTKGFFPKTYLLVNDDTSIQELWRKNQLLRVRAKLICH